MPEKKWSYTTTLCLIVSMGIGFIFMLVGALAYMLTLKISLMPLLFDAILFGGGFFFGIGTEWFPPKEQAEQSEIKTN